MILKRIWGRLTRMRYPVDPFGTHSEFLLASINYVSRRRRVGQRIVFFEVGTGGMSSKIFREQLGEIPDCSLRSFEDNEQWIETYQKQYPPHEFHKLIHIQEGNSWVDQLNLELASLAPTDIVLAFIDSSPWQSRIDAVRLLKNRCTIFLVHDIDYLARSSNLGYEIAPILCLPTSRFHYGNLRKENLGSRDYSEVCPHWIEAFPELPGYFTGPPTLIGSMKDSLDDLDLPLNTIAFRSPPRESLR